MTFPESIEQFLKWLEATPLAVTILENEILFPWIESIHVLAIVLVVGTISIIDLRLLGIASLERAATRLMGDVLLVTTDTAESVEVRRHGPGKFGNGNSAAPGCWEVIDDCGEKVAGSARHTYQRWSFKRVRGTSSRSRNSAPSSPIRSMSRSAAACS
jgi:hypothetical protein